MASATVENYLKHAFVLQQQGDGDALVSMGRLAGAVGVTPGSATAMAKTLAEAGLLEHEPRAGVRLTTAGERLALGVLRRHRLIEQFLVEVLGMDWAEVHAEAEELEHAVSDKVLDRIDRLLGHPKADPHGDPIPAANACSEGPASVVGSLADCPLGEPLAVARVLDQSPEFLQLLDRRGLVPGAGVQVDEREEAADAVVVRPVGKRRATLGVAAARKVLVRRA